jgi:hypothetical protein
LRRKLHNLEYKRKSVVNLRVHVRKTGYLRVLYTVNKAVQLGVH